MAEDIASLGLKVDSQGVAAGAQGLDAFAASADRADAAAGGATSAADALAAASREVQASSNAAAAALQRSNEALLLNTRNVSASARAASQAAQSSKTAFDPLTLSYRKVEEAATDAAAAADESGSALLLNTRRVSASAATASQAAKATSQSFDPLTLTYRKVAEEQEKFSAAQVRSGLSAKAYANQMRILPAQITDIATSLVSGQPAYLVAIQQGGQLRDGFGSIGGAARALLSVLNPVVLGLAAVAAAAALVGVAYAQGQAESYEFTKAVALSGNAAGTTAARLAVQAEAIDGLVGTQREASKVLAQLAASGRVSADQLQGAAQAAIQLQHSAGIAAEQTAKQFIALGEKPADASQKLNEQYHYLTASVYKQIRALEDEGRTAEAAAIAQQAFQAAIQERAAEVERHLGTLPRLARGAGAAFAEMWDALRGLGREKTPQELLAEIEERIANLKSGAQAISFDSGGGGAFFDNSAAIQAEEARAAKVRAGIKADTDAAKAQSSAAITNAKKIADAKVLADAKPKIDDQSDRAAEASRRARFNIDLQAIKQKVAAENDAVSQGLDQLEARRSAGLVSEADYYAQRRRFIEAGTTAQLRGLDQENRRLAAETATIADAAAKAKAKADGLVGQGSPQYAKALDDSLRKQSEAQSVQLQNDAQIRENLAEKVRLTKEAASTTAVLNVQEVAGIDSVTRAYTEARDAADDYIDSVIRGQQRELAGQGVGNQRRQFDQGRFAIDDQYTQQRKQIEREHAADLQRRGEDLSAAEEAAYARRLSIVDDSLARELDLYEKHWSDLLAGEQDWTKGAGEALANYMDEAANTAKLTENLVGNFLGGAEAAWVKFTTTGKLSFRDLINSTIADLARLTTQKFFTSILGMFAGGGTGTSFGGLNSSTIGMAANGAVFGNGAAHAFAKGGAFTNSIVTRPTLFPFAKGTGLMGEAGPEAIMPLKRMSGGQLGVLAAAGGGSEIKISIINNAAGVTHTTERISATEVRIIAREEVARGAPDAVAAHLDNPNSRVSKSVSRNTTAGRQRN